MTRHVMNADEVCRAWVWGDRDHARTPTSNLSFTTHDGLYSYRTRIASRMQAKTIGTVFFVTEFNYSVTTNKQLGYLNYALSRRSTPIIKVPSHVPLHKSELKIVWKEMIAEAQKLWQRAQRARSRKDDYISEANWRIEQTNTMVDLFNMKVPKTTYDQVNETMKIYDAQLRLKYGVKHVH